MKIASKFEIVFMTLTNSTTFHEAWGVDSKKFCIRNSQKEPLYPRRQKCFLVWWHTPKHALTTQMTMEMSVQFKINMTLAATAHWWEWTRDWTIHARWETPYLPSYIVLLAISTLRTCSALVNQAMAPGPPCQLPGLVLYSSMVHWAVLRSAPLFLETCPNIPNSFHSRNLSSKPHEIWSCKLLTLISQAPNVRPETYLEINECML